MGRAAGQEDHDDRLVAGARAGPGFVPEQVGKGEAADGEAADAEEVAPRQTVAEPLAGTEDGEHGRVSRRRGGIACQLLTKVTLVASPTVVKRKQHASIASSPPLI